MEPTNQAENLEQQLGDIQKKLDHIIETLSQMQMGITYEAQE